MAKTSIEWASDVWNPVVGCSLASPGCTNCYAMKMAARLALMNPKLRHYQGLTKPSDAGPVWTGALALSPDVPFYAPLRRKAPTTYFVNSMSDLFHEDVPDHWIDRVFSVMALTPQHTYQVLTKRSARMRDYIESVAVRHPDLRRIEYNDDGVAARVMLEAEKIACGGKLEKSWGPDWTQSWPLPNVWLGVSAEDQRRADERIPDLLSTPAAVRFVSAEPLLGPIDLTKIKYESGIMQMADGAGKFSHFDALRRERRLDWVIVGGESGPNARPMHPAWARSIRDQCVGAGAKFFFKQWGTWLVGERQRASDDLKTWTPDVLFPDGSDFAVVSDGHDIVLGAAETEKHGPKKIWQSFWGWHGHLIKRAPTKSLRELDGQKWDEMPA